jgi:hypothetical protein
MTLNVTEKASSSPWTAILRFRVKKQIPVNNDKNILLFLSQCLSALVGRVDGL